jgi:hypothetical protein
MGSAEASIIECLSYGAVGRRPRGLYLAHTGSTLAVSQQRALQSLRNTQPCSLQWGR